MEKKQLSILFVDDDKFLLDMYSVKFSNNGFDVHTLQNSEDALKLLRDGSEPDIILLDVVMPGMNGIDLLSTIRTEKLAKNSVIIMLTNQGLTDDVAKAKQLDVDGYIIKATTIPSEVLAEVQKIYSSVNKQ
jgi:two-component system response regulator MtrA